MNIYPETMVDESIAAKSFKIGSVIIEIWHFLRYCITLWSAIASMSKNEHDESIARRNCLIAF